LYSGISDFTKGDQPGTNTANGENGDLVTDCHSILAGWSCWMCMCLIMLGRQKHIQQSYRCLNRVPLRLRWLSKS